MEILKKVSTHTEAISLFNNELAHFQQFATQPDDISKGQGKAGLAYLAYFRGYLQDPAFWKTWSPASAAEAAEKLGIPTKKVACTTNHVKYFNGILKGPLFTPYTRSGRLPRLDAWVLLLLTQVLPLFFHEKQRKLALRDYRHEMRTLPSSKDQSAEPEKIADKINCSSDDIMDQWLHDTIHVDDDSSKEAKYLEGFPLLLPTEPNTPHFPVDLEASFGSLSIKKFPAAPNSVTDISDANDYSFASEYAQESADLAEILLDLTMTSAEQHDYRRLTTRQQSLLATGLSMMQKAEDAV